MNLNNNISLVLQGFIEQFNDSRKPPLIAITIFVIIAAIMLYFGVYRSYGLIVLGIIVSIVILYLFIIYPRFWIYTITLSLFIFFRKAEEGVSALDVITGLLYLLTLFAWLIWQFAFKRTKLVTNIGDWFVIAFFILLFGNSIIAVVHGVSFLNWIREYSIMALVLFYFPIRHYFYEEKYLIRLIILLGFAIVMTDLQQFYDYYKLSMTNIVYAYQIISSVRINQVIYTAATAFGIIFVLYEKKFSKQMIFLSFTMLNVIAIVSTFSRTFWIILLFEIVLFIILVPIKQKIKLLAYSFIISAAFFITIMLVFSNRATAAFQLMENRLESSTKGRKDVSVVGRLAEYDVVLKRISEYPLGGNGLAKEFTFMFPVKRHTIHTLTTHNGYLFLFYRIGIPLSLFYIFFLFYFTIKSFTLFFRSKENLYKILSLGSFCGLLVMIISDFSSTQFCVRDGSFVLAFAFAFYSIAEKNNRKNSNQLNDYSN